MEHREKSILGDIIGRIGFELTGFRIPIRIQAGYV